MESSKNAAARAKRRGEQSGEPEPVSGLHRFLASSSSRQRDEKPAGASRAAQAAFFEGERRALRVAAASRLELSNSKADIPRSFADTQSPENPEDFREGQPPCRLAIEREEARLKAAAIPLRSPELSTYFSQKGLNSNYDCNTKRLQL